MEESRVSKTERRVMLKPLLLIFAPPPQKRGSEDLSNMNLFL
jgi:hypothetical protein